MYYTPMFRNLLAFFSSRWEKRVVDYVLKNKDEYPDFNEFASFIKKQALIKNRANVIDRRKGRDHEDHVKSY
jgi:hypothetical protein